MSSFVPTHSRFEDRQRARAAGLAAHFRRQLRESLSLLAGMQAEREERAALAPPPTVSAAEALAEMARLVG